MTDRLPRDPTGFVKSETKRLKSENADLATQVNQYREFVQGLDSLFAASANFTNDEQLMPFLRRILQNAMRLVNAPDGSLALLDDETDELVFVIVLGELSDKLTNHRIPADQGIAGWVVRNRKPALVRNTQTDPRFYNKIDETFTFSTQSIAAAPLIGDRKAYGIIEVLNQPGDVPFSEHDLALLKLLCRAAGEALADIDRMSLK